MSLFERIQDFVTEKVLGEPPVLRVYGNCESCLAEFDGKTRHYINLKDASAAGRLVGDFGLVGKTIRVKSGERMEYEGHIYHGMRHVVVSDFRRWLKGQKVDVKTN